MTKPAPPLLSLIAPKEVPCLIISYITTRLKGMMDSYHRSVWALLYKDVTKAFFSVLTHPPHMH